MSEFRQALYDLLLAVADEIAPELSPVDEADELLDALQGAIEERDQLIEELATTNTELVTRVINAETRLMNIANANVANANPTEYLFRTE